MPNGWGNTWTFCDSGVADCVRFRRSRSGTRACSGLVTNLVRTGNDEKEASRTPVDRPNSPMSTLLRRSLAASSSPSSSRLFSSTPARLATAVDDLAFPSKPNPTPWEIFHLDPASQPTPKELKDRFYALARRFHPDRQPSASPDSPTAKGKARDTSAEFKQIVGAYEILKSPSKRSTYLRRGGSATGGADPWAAYDFTRGRPMPTGRRPHTSSEHWDWAADPYNPHYRPAYGMGKTSSGWKSEGTVATNGNVFLALVGLVFVATPLSIWTAVPSDVAQSSLASAIMTDDELKMVRGGSGRSGGSMRRHEDAAQSLERARREAKVGGQAKMAAIRCLLLSTSPIRGPLTLLLLRAAGGMRGKSRVEGHMNEPSRCRG